MRLLPSRKTNLIKDKIGILRRFPRNMRRTLLLIAGLAISLLVILASIYCGMVLKQKGISHVLKQAALARLDIIPHYFRGLTARPECLTIDIKHLDYQKLAYKRQTALSHGVLLTSSEDYVPALVSHEGKTHKAEIRLKGDWTGHLEGNKWSFRIRIKGGNSILGMQRFSIHHPKERAYIYEWIFHQALRREGILSPRYGFIKVTLNGRNLGIYALEEHFGKILIENNRSREGLIIKFNEDALWKERFVLPELTKMQINLQAEFSADIDAFGMGKILKNPFLREQFIIAKDLLEAFRTGNLPAHKVFDVKKMAKYIAISELMDAIHGAGIWNNLRFYYNPVTSLLEPIGFDAMAGGELKDSWDGFPAMAAEFYSDLFQDKLFSDVVFFEEYMKALEEVSRKPYLDELYDDINVDLQKNMDIIYSEFPYYPFYSKDIFYRNQNLIRKLLDFDMNMHAYFYKARKNSIELKIGCTRSLPVEVLGLFCGDGSFLPVSERTVLFPRKPFKLVDYKTVSFLFPEGFTWSDARLEGLKVKYALFGTDGVKHEKVFPYANLSDDFPENDFMRREPNAHDFKFLKIDKSSGKIFIEPGKWSIGKDMIIPAGFKKVICPEGTQLDLSDSAKILSYSPLEFIGSEEHPIIIRSADSTGQGIVVMNAGEWSKLKYVVFDNLSNPEHGAWRLSGAVTFYESPVAIDHCRLANNRSEDTLNLIRSDFVISKTLFEKTFSDAFDADFCEGEITDSSFVDCGNDGIDVSGSAVKVNRVFIQRAGDKGISVGEDSKVVAEDVEVKDSRIAAASKDMSELDMKNVKVTDCAVGIAVYRKKPEFGPAEVTVTGLKMTGCDVPYLVEEGSELIVEGKSIAADRKDVYKILGDK